MICSGIRGKLKHETLAIITYAMFMTFLFFFFKSPEH